MRAHLDPTSDYVDPSSVCQPEDGNISSDPERGEIGMGGTGP